MKYNEFTERVSKELMDYLPSHLQECELVERTVTKVNQTYKGLSLIHSLSEKQQGGPTIYYEDMYKMYQDFNEDFERFMNDLANQYEDAMRNLPLNFFNEDLKIEDNAIMVIVNTEKNKELLETIPHKNMLDLSVIYRCMMGCNEGGYASVIVTNELLENKGMTLEELHEHAVRNTRVMFPAKCYALDEDFFLLSNESKMLGAVELTDNAVLDMIANRIQDDLMIIPSSIHELFVIRADMTRIGELLNIIRTTNESLVDEKDFLSNNLYYYSRNLHSLQVISEMKIGSKLA